VFGVPLGAVLWAEVVAAAGLVAVVRRDLTLVPAGLLLVGSVLLAAGRHRGVPLHRTVGTWWRFTRRRRRPVADAGDPRVAALGQLLHRLSVDTVSLRGGRQFGVCFDGSGWAAVLALEPDPAVLASPGSARQVGLSRLACLLTIDDIRLSCAQLLVHTAPAPAGWLDPAFLPVTSYRRIRPLAVAGMRRTWVVLRLDPAAGQDAIEARGGGVQGAHRALKRAVSRSVELLETDGVTARPLDDEGVRSALTLNLLGSASPAGNPPDAPLAESWACWRAGGTAQVSWWLSGWPAGRDPVEPLLRSCSRCRRCSAWSR
jgi:type VII secretion protein EccE